MALRQQIIRAAGIVGTLAIVVALGFFINDGELSANVFIPFVLGITGLGIWIGLAPEEIGGWISGRQAAAGTASIIVTVIFIAAVIFAYAQADRQNITVDFTAGERFSLNAPSLETINRVVSIEVPLRFVGFYPRQTLRDREAADIILRQYDQEGGEFIEVEYVDPDEEPLLAQTYGYDVVNNANGAVFVSFVLPNGEPDLGSITWVTSIDERTISTTISNLITVSDVKIYFTTGHTEYDIDSNSVTGLVVAQEYLRRALGIQSEKLNLLTEGTIPEDATALAVIGPNSPFDQSEVDLIAEFVANGGGLLVLANPPFVDTEFGGTGDTFLIDSPFNTFLWEEFGVRFAETLMVDQGSSFANEFNPVPAFYGNQEIVNDLSADTTLVLSLARSLEVVPEPQNDQQARYLREPLMFSSEDSYGESELQLVRSGTLTEFDTETDIQGPLPMGVAVRTLGELEEENTPRVVLIGDADWATNDFISRTGGNSLLWDGVMRWVTQDPTFEELGEEGGGVIVRRDLLPITATDQERQRIAALTNIGLPGLILAIGLLVWFIRRRR